MTEDMHEERLQAVEAFGDSFVSVNSYEMHMMIIDYKAFTPQCISEAMTGS